MHIMSTSFAKAHAFTVNIRFSFKPNCLKQCPNSNPQFSSSGLVLKPHINPKPHNYAQLSTWFWNDSSLVLNDLGNLRSISKGIGLRGAFQFCPVGKGRSFSGSAFRKVGEDRSGSTLGAEKALPWLASNRVQVVKTTKKESKDSSWQHSAKMLLEKEVGSGTSHSSWEESARNSDERKGVFSVSSGSKRGERGIMEDRRNWYEMRNDDVERAEDEEGEVEEVDDPRWDKIRNRFGKMVNAKPGVHRWNKQESWGKKTWKEVTESSTPKLVGEGVYGVGPVLAALSASRREFYTLYVQEGLDLSSSNKKKKDKKGFERILKMAEKIGLSIKETSKHDLNMVVDNRPHQGLVLDASPLEMVKIKELGPVSIKEDAGSLWVALDEVTDPQNLGAIIRSAYFFGVSGVVLCAKNSAPLSGIVSKASAGSLELMELQYCKNMMQFLTSSSENGWRVLGGSVSPKSIPLNEVSPGEPTILVLGSEGTGLRPLVERSCTQLIRIPGNIPVDVSVEDIDDVKSTETNSLGKDFRSFLAVESLNVSVAAGVLLHHLIGNNCNKGQSMDDRLA